MFLCKILKLQGRTSQQQIQFLIKRGEKIVFQVKRNHSETGNTAKIKVESCGRAGRERFSPQSFQTQRIIIIYLATALSPVHNFSFSFLWTGIFPICRSEPTVIAHCCLLGVLTVAIPHRINGCVLLSALFCPADPGGFVISRKRIPRIAHKQGQGHPNKDNGLCASCL